DLVGIPTRNANSVAAARLVTPNSSATKIVAAERDVPGNTPATTWATPTSTATVQVIVLRSPSTSARRAAKCSASSIHAPPRTSAQAIGATALSSSQPRALTTMPSTEVTAKARISFQA